MDGRLTIRANAFYTRLTDQQVFASLSNLPRDQEIINVARSHNDGVELEAAFAYGAWNLWYSAGLLHAELDEVEFNGSNFSGNDFPEAPDWTVSFGMTYGRDRGLFAEMDTTLRPQTKASIDNRSDVFNEGRTLVNARLGSSFPHAEDLRCSAATCSTRSTSRIAMAHRRTRSRRSSSASRVKLA